MGWGRGGRGGGDGRRDGRGGRGVGGWLEGGEAVVAFLAYGEEF